MPGRTERQQRLLDALRSRSDPMTGAELAARCGVTRQVVVHDIALLRAQNIPIVSTPRGYWLQPHHQSQRFVLSVFHPPHLTEKELQILVDYGVHVVDVLIEHPLYGELRGSLHLSSRRDVNLFMEKVNRTRGPLLSNLTDGHHLHTVECADESRLKEAVEELRQHGIQVFDP